MTHGATARVAIGRAAIARAALALAVTLAAVPPPTAARSPAGGGAAATPAVAAPSPSVGGCSVSDAVTLDWVTAQQLLLRCNRALRGAQRAVEVARADVRIAGQIPNPTLSGGVENLGARGGLGAGGLLDKQLDYQARLDQPIERGNKRGLRTEAAEQTLAAARWSAADTLRQQQLLLADAWVDLWGAQERVRLQQDVIGLFRRTLDGARRRLGAGDIAAADVARIRLDVERAEGERTLAEGALADARHALAALLALDGDAAALQATEPWPALDLSGVEPVAPAQSDRPDLLAARAQVASAEAQRRLARSLQTRDVSVGVAADRFAPPSGNGWTLGVYVSIPLFLHHRNEGEIARAEADHASADEARARIEQEAGADLRRRLAAQAAARARRDRLQRDALPLAEKVASDAELAYRKGAGTVLDLLDALRQLRALQLAALDARLDDDRANAAARAEMLTRTAAADPVFGAVLRWLQN
ncbi:MAG: TolC family protein [Lautropia sp.]